MKTPEEVAAERAIERREIRAANYAVKQANDWACAECGRTGRVLAVTIKTTGESTTRCEDRCLDRRIVTVNPLQFDERERDRAAAA